MTNALALMKAARYARDLADELCALSDKCRREGWSRDVEDDAEELLPQAEFIADLLRRTANTDNPT